MHVSGVAAEQGPAPPAFEEWSHDLDWVERVLGSGKPTVDDLSILQNRIERVKQGLTKVHSIAERNLAEQRKLLDTLGPPPADGAPPESRDIVRQRRQLEREIAKWDGRVKKSELLSQRSRELLKRLASTAREIKADTLTTREVSPLRRKALRRISRDADETWGTVTRAVSVVAKDAELTGWPLLAGCVAGTLLVLLVLSYVRRGLLTRLHRLNRDGQLRRRLNHLAVLGRIIADGVLPAVAIVAAGAAAFYWMPSNRLLADVLIALGACAALLVMAVAALEAAFVAPGTVRRSLMLEMTRARRLVRLLSIAAACVLASLWFKLVAEPLKIGHDLYFVAVFPLRLIAAACFLLLFGSGFRRAPNRRATFVSLVASLSFGLLAANPLLIAFGYGPMADWLFFGFSGTLTALGVLHLLQGASRESLAHVRRQHESSGGRDQFATDASSAGGSVFHAFLFGLVQVGLWAATAALLLFAWGVGSVQALDWFDVVRTGIAIGKVRIAPLDIILALAVFGVGLGLSRLAQHAFDRRVLRRARVDAGTRNALRTCAGYTGVMIAVLASVLSLGIDLSNLALIAGALSVGVGFGMQTIVNNFVSGIILLIERPIKTGDWVVVGDCEGIVRQVRVRATEIETFQRSSVLVPNSKIISEAVVNWTFNDLTGRVDIAVDVDPKADPDSVSRIMTQAAHEHTSVLEVPPPHAFLRSLTQGAMNFQLWAYIDVRDSRNKFRVESALLTRIMKEFQEYGIRLAQPFALREIGVADAESRDEPPVAANTRAGPG